MCTKLVAPLLVLGLLIGCGRSAPPPPSPADEAGFGAGRRGAGVSAPTPPPPPPPLPEADRLPAAPGELPPERRAIQVIVGTDGATSEQLVDADVARARGLTVIDLSDDWAPAVLARENRYRDIYVGLATDRGDGDGQPLVAGEHNYLELYGIPPALSVLRRRFLDDAVRSCDRKIDVETLLAVDEVRTWGAASEQKEQAKQRARAARLEAARVAAGVETLAALAEGDARQAKDVAEHASGRGRAGGVCADRGPARLRGVDGAVPAPARQLRHRDAHRDARLPAEAHRDGSGRHPALDAGDAGAAAARQRLRRAKRVLTERAMEAAGFIEDGSVGEGSPRPSIPTYPGSDGVRHRVPDLATDVETAMLARLGIASAADALAFFQRHPRADFRWLKVAVRLPPPPEYYGRTMELSAEIDRGDVWYDFPFDAKRRPTAAAAQALPDASPST